MGFIPVEMVVNHVIYIVREDLSLTAAQTQVCVFMDVFQIPSGDYIAKMIAQDVTTVSVTELRDV